MNEKETLLLEIKALIADSHKDGVSKVELEKTIKELNDRIAKLSKPEIDSLPEMVNKLMEATTANAAAIKAMEERSTKAEISKPKTFKEALIDAVTEKAKEVPGLLVERNDDYGKRLSLKDYMNRHGKSPEMVVKAEMLESTIVQSSVATIRLAELDAQRVGVPLTLYPHVTDWMPSKSITRPTMSLMVVYSYSDGAATKTEGSASTISSFLLKTVEFKSFFIATFFTLSDETLDDLNEVMEEIAATAPSKILDKVDGYILGTAGDDSTAIAGLFTSTKHTDFAGGTTYLSTVPQANAIDVISKMKLQAETSKYKPDAVIMNPADIEGLGAKKDQLDNSIVDRRVVWSTIGEPTNVCGMRIIKSTAITADTLAVVDSQQLMIGKKKELTMEMGYNAADLTEGQKTVVLKVRVAFGVRDPLAVIYCSGLDAAITDINKA